MNQGNSLPFGDDAWLEIVPRAALEISQASGLALFASPGQRLVASWGSLQGLFDPQRGIPRSGPRLQVIPVEMEPPVTLVLAYPGSKEPAPQPLLRVIVSLMAALAQNQALKENLQEREEQVKALLRSTIEAQETERERICLEVHDGVAQSLVSTHQYLQTLEKAASLDGAEARNLLLKASARLRQALQEAREVINSLQPTVLNDLGLGPALRHQVRQLQEELGWEVDFHIPPLRFSKSMEVGLYRIAQEAINNAKRHARTKRLLVHLQRSGDQVLMEVRDWGVGFDGQAKGFKGTGLLSMRRRAELLGGSFYLESSPNQGTSVKVEVYIT